MTIPIRKNTAQTITVGPFLDKTDGVTPELSLTVTGCHITLVADTADGNAPTLVIDADATASSGDNDLVHITNDNAGYYSLELTTTQTNRSGHGRLCINDDDVHCPVFHDLVFLDANVFDSLYGTDKLNVDMVEISGDATAADNLEDMFEETTAIGNLIDFVDGTGYAGGTIKLQVDLVKILGTTLTETVGGYLTAAFKKFFDVETPVLAADAAGMNVIADAVLVRNWASVTYTGTVRCALTALQAVRNKFNAAAGAGGYSVKKEDDSTESWTGTLTIDGDGNISAMDPDS